MDNTSLFFQIFNLHGQNILLDKLMLFATNELIYLMGILILLLSIKGKIKEKKAVLLIILALPISLLLIKAIHLFYFEPRPWVTFHLTPLADYHPDASFPSRHATIAAALAFPFAFFKSKWSILFLSLTLLIGISRIYVGVHYPLDIIGGFFTASAALFISLQIGKILKKHLLAA